jgi:hypothetical protein
MKEGYFFAKHTTRTDEKGKPLTDYFREDMKAVAIDSGWVECAEENETPVVPIVVNNPLEKAKGKKAKGNAVELAEKPDETAEGEANDETAEGEANDETAK